MTGRTEGDRKRQTILGCVIEHPGSKISDIPLYLKMRSQEVERYVSVLEEEGSIKTEGRGKERKVYPQ